MNAWDIFDCDLGWGTHPVVVVSHPERVARKDPVEVVACSSQRAGRRPNNSEVLLDEADGLDWATLCKCDCLYAVPKAELGRRRGSVITQRRVQIVRVIIQAHGWPTF